MAIRPGRGDRLPRALRRDLRVPIELNSEVTKLEHGDDGRFRLDVDARTIIADEVVVATGPFRRRLCQSSPRSSLTTSSRRTLSATGGRMRCQRTRSLWSVAATPLSDREGAVGDAQGRALGRFSPEAAAPTCARARPLLVAQEGANPRQDGRLTPRPPAEHARHADRLEPTRATEALRGQAKASRHRRRRANGSL